MAKSYSVIRMEGLIVLFLTRQVLDPLHSISLDVHGKDLSATKLSGQTPLTVKHGTAEELRLKA